MLTLGYAIVTDTARVRWGMVEVDTESCSKVSSSHSCQYTRWRRVDRPPSL
jgi:hypothetical protein